MAVINHEKLILVVHATPLPFLIEIGGIQNKVNISNARSNISNASFTKNPISLRLTPSIEWTTPSCVSHEI